MQGNAYPIQVLTDHDNLKYFLTTKVLNSRQARWAEELAAYDFFVVYRPGRLNPADPPSRRPDYVVHPGDGDPKCSMLPVLQKKLGQGIRGPDQGRLVETVAPTVLGRPGWPAGHAQEGAGTEGHELLVPRLSVVRAAEDETGYEPPTIRLLEFIQEMQERDAFSASRIRDIRNSADPGEFVEVPSDPGNALTRWRIDDRRLLLRNESIYIPQSQAIRQELLRIHHDDPWAGHFGAEKTAELLRRKFYWNELRADVDRYVLQCDICQHVKAKQHKPYGQLAKIPMPIRPFESITMDFIVGLPPVLHRGITYDSILVIVDRYTKLAKYFPCMTSITAPDLAELFIDSILTDYGSPSSIISDRDKLFTSHYWSAFCYYLRIKRNLSTAFHPQTDGQSERQNRTLENYLRAYSNYHQDNWVQLLPRAQFAYNSVIHSSTHMSPFRALLGFDPIPPRGVVDNALEGEAAVAININVTENDKKLVPAVRERIEHLHKLQEELENSV